MKSLTLFVLTLAIASALSVVIVMAGVIRP
jgi:hypothetical protein